MKKILIFVIILFPILLLSKTLTFVATQFPPYVYSEHNKIKGFNVEILNEIFRRMNVKVDYLILPWARGVKMVKNGEADAIFPFFKNEERLKFADFSQSFTSEPIAMFVQKDSTILYEGNLSKLSNYSFGRVIGYSSGEKFDNAVENNILKIQKVRSSKLNIRKLFKNRFDILVDNKYSILYEIKKLNQQNKIKQLKPILADTKAYLGFSKKRNHKEIIKRFNIILKNIKKDGTYDKIIDSYFEK